MPQLKYWDGTRYVPILGGISQETADARYVKKTGDTMTGPLSVTNPVIGDHAASKAYADSLVADSGWVNCVVRAPYAANGTPRVRRIGKVCYLTDGWSNASITATVSLTIGDIPPGYRPANPIYHAAGTNNAATISMWVIGIDGSIAIRTAATVSSYYRLDGLSYICEGF